MTILSFSQVHLRKHSEMLDSPVRICYLSIAGYWQSHVVTTSKRLKIMIVEAKELAVRKLADARAECRVSQEKLAKEARVSKPVVVRAENGFTVTRISAHAILKALNKFRTEYGLEPIDFYDLDWKLQGEEP